MSKTTLASIIGYLLIGLFVLAIVSLEIYCWVRYGNAPRNEVPNWVWWFMWRN